MSLGKFLLWIVGTVVFSKIADIILIKPECLKTNCISDTPVLREIRSIITQI